MPASPVTSAAAILDPATVQSLAPLTLTVPDRAVPLQLRVSAPLAGDRLPVIVLSHGHGPSHHLSSLQGYGPLATYWATRGFCVLQPTHEDSATLELRGSDDPEAPLFARSRARDVSHVLDHLDEIEAAVPGLIGRLDRDRIAVAGHSMGGQTASLVLGTRLGDPATGDSLDLSDPRVRAGVVLAGVGRGGDALSEYAATHYTAFASPDFATMTTPALVVYGDADASEHLTVAGAGWHADPYHLAPGPKALLRLHGAGHGLGGVSGWDAAETDDEDPDRVRLVGELTTAYLSTQLGVDPAAWPTRRQAFQDASAGLGDIEEK